MNDLSAQPRETPFETEKLRPGQGPSVTNERGYFNPGVSPYYKLLFPRDAEKENSSTLG